MYLKFSNINQAKQLLLFLADYYQDFTPVLTIQQRDQIILQRYNNGEAISDLAREYAISSQRVHQIVKPKQQSGK